MVDLLAGGRLILGFGGGWVEREFDAFGVDRSRRGALLESSCPGSAGLWPTGPRRRPRRDRPARRPALAAAGRPALYLGGTAPGR